MLNIRKKFNKITVIILIFTFTFSILSTPKKSEALGAEFTALLGGAAYTGSSLAGLGTAIGVLGVAGLAITVGAGIWYLGDKLYNKWKTDKILNQDGSVTTNEAMIQSTQEFLDTYDPTISLPIEAEINHLPGVVSTHRSIDSIGNISEVEYTGVPVATYIVQSSTYVKWFPVSYSFIVPVDSDGYIYFSTYVVANSQVKSKVQGISIGEAYSNTNVSVRIKNLYPDYITSTSGTGNGFHIDSTYTMNDGSTKSQTLDSTTYIKESTNSTFTSKYAGSSMTFGVASVDGYPMVNNPYGTGSISLDAPILNNTGSISAQKVIDSFGADKVITAPSDWGVTVPLDSTQVYNPGLVRPVEIPEVREVDDPITYPDTENPTMPEDVPSIWQWLWNLLKGIWDAITSIPTLLMSLWEILKNLLQSILEWIIAIPAAIAAIPGAITDWIQQKINSPPKIPLLPQLFLNIILILLALITFFIAVTSYILSIRNIMPDASLLPDLVQQGISFTKNIRFPVFNMTLYTIVTTTLFIFIVIRVVGMLRKSIHARYG